MAAGVRDIIIRFTGDTKDLDASATKGQKILAGFNKAAGLAGAAAGGAIMAGLAGAFEQEDALAKLKAQAGGAAWAANAGKAAGNLYANAYGESMTEVGDAVKAVMSQGLLDTTASTAEIESLTGKAMSLAQAFDQDVTGAVNAAGQMVKTGLAENADEALDILTVGFQKGADKAGDLLDTFNEYGTQFRKLGITGKEATGLLTQGLAAGARDADIVADAFKEMSLRTQGELSKLSSDGTRSLTDLGQVFKDLGIDGQKAQKDLAGGGVKAAAATDQLLDKLRAVKDPAKRSAAAVMLFGTQAEDLGDALFALDLSKAEAEIGDVEGAAAKADAALGQTASATLTSFKRSVQKNLTEVMAKAIPYITGAANALKPYAPIIVPLTAVLAGFAAAVMLVNAGVKAWAAITKAAMVVQRAFTAVALASRLAFLALNAAMRANPIGLVITAVTLLVAGLVLAYKKSESFRNIVNKVRDTAIAAFGKVVDWLKIVGEWAGKIVGFYINAYKKLFDILTTPFRKAFEWIKEAYDRLGIGKIIDGIGKVAGSIGKVAGGAGGLIGKINPFADGGVANGWSLVGERGPELVNFGSPSRVLSNADSAAALGSGSTTVEIHATGPTLSDIVRVEIRQHDRSTRQAVLAGSRRALA